MPLEITTSERRFSVKCKYDQFLVDYFQTINKRYFDFEKQIWSFPSNILDEFKSHLSKNKVTFTEIATKNMAKLNVKSEHIELSFASYIKNFQDYVNIDGAEYLRDERKFIIPLSQESTLCNMLLDHNFSIIRSGEDKMEEQKDDGEKASKLIVLESGEVQKDDDEKSSKLIVLDSDDDDELCQKKKKRRVMIESDSDE